MSNFTFGDPIVDEDLGNIIESDSTPPPAEPVTPPVVEPAAEPAAEPVVEAAVEPVAEPVAEPVVETPPVVPKTPTPEELAAMSAEERNRRIMIPKSRLDEVSNKNKQLTEELAMLKSSLAPRTTPQAEDPALTAMLEEHAKLLLDGKEKEAAQVMTKVMTKVSMQASQTAVERATSQVQHATRQAEWLNTVSEIESLVPELNPDVPGFDPSLSATIGALAETYMRTMTPRDALDRALVVGLQGERPEILARLRQELAPVKPVPKVVPPPVKPISTATRAAATQPPVVANKTVVVPAVQSALTMTEEEFDALPEATRRRMRGDTVG